MNGQLKNKYGDAFIRGNNGTCNALLELLCVCNGNSCLSMPDEPARAATADARRPSDSRCSDAMHAVLYISTVE